MDENKTDFFPEISDKKKKAFLVAYAECGTVTHAAEAAGISDRIHRYWLDENSKQYDPEYAAAFERAEKMSLDLLVREARRRAIDGVQEPIYYQGEKVGTKLRYSDTLLMFLAKAADPDRYAEHKKIEQTNTGEQTLNVRFHKPDSD